MTDDDDESRYKVGYKRPPKDHQFKKGSKKPASSGRQKGHQSYRTIIDDLLNETITVAIGGEMQTLTKTEFMVRRGYERAIKADSVNELLALVKLSKKLAPEPLDSRTTIFIQTIPGDF